MEVVRFTRRASEFESLRAGSPLPELLVNAVEKEAHHKRPGAYPPWFFPITAILRDKHEAAYLPINPLGHDLT